MGLLKSKNLSAAKKSADQWFSVYVRLRDSDHAGYCECVTCGKSHHWKQIHCGHFMSRRHTSTRWHPENAHAQCCACNTYGAGLQYRHGLSIDQRHGDGTAERLETIANQSLKLSKEEVMVIARVFKQKAEALGYRS